MDPRNFDVQTLRVVDAVANRCSEGLRTLEDWARFVLESPPLTEELKNLRHELFQCLERVPVAHRLMARDTVGDIGTVLGTTQEFTRCDWPAIITAASRRVQESLRTLEETGKLVDPAWAEAFKQLRYRAYTLEKSIATASRMHDDWSEVRLYVLIDPQSDLEAFTRLVSQLIEAGVHAIQLRVKNLADRAFWHRARRLVELTRHTGTKCIINDRPDIARLVGADGVHVGQDDLPVRAVRQIVGPETIIGVSTHSLAQARQAVEQGAQYIGIGPVFASQTKEFAPSQIAGLEVVRAVASAIPIPAFPIGGITLENLSSVLATGIRRVAVSSAIIRAENPGEAARAFLRAIGAAAIQKPDQR